MQGKVAYRQLVLSQHDEEKLRRPLVAPFNDMIGWREKGYVAYLVRRYDGLGFPKMSIGKSISDSSAFADAAVDAVKGRIAPVLAEHLGRLRFAPDGTVADVPDLSALAAWSLLEAVRRQPLKLYTCPTCKRKWLGTTAEGSRYCQRSAPGYPSKDCRTLAYERRLAGDSAYRAYRREYKRVTEAQRRGATEILDMFRWREENSATDWVRFEEWKEQRATKEEDDG